MVAQVYIAQFLNYVPWSGWLNHPLVRLPWIRFIPELLRQFRCPKNVGMGNSEQVPKQIAFGTTVLLLLAAAGCAPAEDVEYLKPEAFVFGRGSDAEKLDPADIDDGESVNSLSQVCEGLLRFKSGTFEIEPGLAESYSISDDGLIYRFQLREDVSFHDNTPLTAETALFSFQRQMDEKHPAHFPEADFPYWNYLYQDIVEVRAVGPMTVEFRLKQPNATLIYALASFPVWLISPTAFETYGRELYRNPVGTGPYRFVQWRPGQAIIYERNPNYWGELARFERLVIRAIPDNTVRLLELKAGKIHGLDGLQPAELRSLEKDERFRVYRQPGMNVGYLAISSLSDRLKDRRIRRALAQSIDRAAIVKLALDGFGKVAEYPIPPGFLGEPEGAPPIQFDPDEAAEVLRQFPDLGNRPLVLATTSAPRPYFPDPVKIASLIRSDLEGVGLKVEIATRDWKSHLNACRSGEFDLALLGWIGDIGDPDNFLSVFFGSWAAKKGSATNISFYKNPDMDRLLLAGRRERDRTKRQLIYEDALRIWGDDLPLIPLLHTESIAVMRREVTGYVLQPIGNHFFGPVGWRELDF